VKSGSSGDRLLFRFPFKTSQDGNQSGSPKEREFPVVVEGEAMDFTRDMLSPMDEDHLPPSLDSAGNEAHIQTVVNLSNKVISDLFAVKPSVCDQKFEVKINDVRFVGHPINLNVGSDRKAESDLLTVNVVFALKADASHDIVNCYHECSQRISIGLKFEEERTGYLSSEATLMLSYHDEETGSCNFAEILRKSRLASTLTKVFDDLTDCGATHLTINRWMSISFCLPQKVHRLALRHHHEGLPSIGPGRIRKCLENLRPYHGVVLITEVDVLLEAHPQDSSPAFLRVIRCINPVKNLLELSADADISLPQVFQVVAQLLYWGRATVIYPLCDNNKYTLHPLAPTFLHSKLAQQFNQEFEGYKLVRVLSTFSSGVTLKELQKCLPSVEEKRNLVSHVS